MHIIKNGLENVVDEAIFKERYEPKGWKVDYRYEAIETTGEVLTTDEQTIKTINSQKRKAKKIDTAKFDDGVIKPEEA